MLGEIQKIFSLSYWKSFFQSPTKKRLTENFISLSFLQGFNYILPLVTLPYLVRVLGVERFGLIAFAQAFLGYFVIIVAYGFNLSATREISINKEDKEKVSRIFSSVMITKIILALFSFFILILCLLTIPKFKSYWLLHLLMFEIVIWDILFPVWFFQGMEKMKFITIIGVISRVITVVFIFVLIRKPNDYILYPVVDFIGNLIAGAWAMKIILKNFKVRFKVPRLTEIKHQLQEGWHIFASTVAVSLYTTSNIFILGIFTNNIIVGYYAAAEKLIKAALGLISPFSQTVYPYISKIVIESKKNALAFIKKILFLFGLITFFISFFIFFFAKPIVSIFLGSQYLNSIIVLRILAFLPFIVALSNVFGVQTMLTFNIKKPFFRILIFAAILSLLLSIILVPTYQYIGTSISWLLTEIFVTISMFFVLKKKGINVLKGQIKK